MADPVTTGGAGEGQNTTVKQPWENLGYESFDAYSQAQAAEFEKLRKQADEKQAMIDRQANELGQLRKSAKPADAPAPTQQATPQPNTPSEDDAVTKEAQRTLRELKITMPADQTARVNEALAKAEPDIVKIVKTDPQSRLVFMRNVLGDEFQLPSPKVDIFEGLEPAAPANKPLHETLQELLNQQKQPNAGKPYPSHVPPRTSPSSTPRDPTPAARRFNMQGGLLAGIEQLKQETK